MIGRRRLAALLGASLSAAAGARRRFPDQADHARRAVRGRAARSTCWRAWSRSRRRATLGQPIVVDNRGGAGRADRRGVGRQGRARRLHAADGLGGAGDDPALDQPFAHLRSAAGSRAGGASGRHADGADRLGQAPRCRTRRRFRRRGARPSRRPQLRLDRRRHDLAPGHGDPEARGRHRHRARALSRRRAGAERPACRPGPGHVHQHGVGRAHGGGEQAAAARRHDARRARRCCPTCRPWRRPAGRPPRSSCGPASWRRPARRGPSSASSSAPSSRRPWRPRCASGWSGSAPIRSATGAQGFAEVLEKDLALWQRVALASGVKVE